LLWAEPTGYPASMVGFPYDDLDGWRAVYPPEAFIGLLQSIADGFDRAIATANKTAASLRVSLKERQALVEELRIAEAAAIHFRSVSLQARFVLARRELSKARTAAEARGLKLTLREVLNTELELARRLYALQSADACLGFEATNHYYYVPQDLAEKVLNCRDLLDRWLAEKPAPEQGSL
jgi:hypothetical protein